MKPPYYVAQDARRADWPIGVSTAAEFHRERRRLPRRDRTILLVLLGVILGAILGLWVALATDSPAPRPAPTEPSRLPPAHDYALAGDIIWARPRP